MGALRFLKERLSERPRDLVAISSIDIRVFADDFNLPNLMITMRKAFRMQIANNPKDAINAQVDMRPILLAAEIRGGDLADSPSPQT